MNNTYVLNLIFRNEPTHIDFIVDYLFKKKTSPDKIKQILRALFKQGLIQCSNELLTVKTKNDLAN
jgi:hypothetical protein